MCIFCDIINTSCKQTDKNIDSNIIFNNNDIIAINDIYPKAPKHILIIPKKHIESIKEINEVEKDLLFKIIMTAKNIAKEKKLKGYKLVFNVGKEGGQTIEHLHLHLLGGWRDKPQNIKV